VAGYSAAPLAQKLGITPHSRLLLARAPAGFSVPDLPEGVVARHRPTVAGGMWVCWPKKASGLQLDLTETQVRAIGLDAGLVDVKVCAVDETWSGLRFVRRLADR
jgi:hypothetical protein